MSSLDPPYTLEDLLKHHEQQVENFKPFGSSNQLVVFHKAAVSLLKEAVATRHVAAPAPVGAGDGHTFVVPSRPMERK